jgi:hypothetical protein
MGAEWLLRNWFVVLDCGGHGGMERGDARRERKSRR